MHRSRRTRQIPAWALAPGDRIGLPSGPETVVKVDRPNKGAFDGDIVYIELADGVTLEKDPNDVFTSREVEIGTNENGEASMCRKRRGTAGRTV
jgi:hypothetical protein